MIVQCTLYTQSEDKRFVGMAKLSEVKMNIKHVLLDLTTPFQLMSGLPLSP